MRSLTVKLTLAFLLVGMLGALLVAALVGQRTRSEFDRFLSERDQTALVEVLGDHYARRGSWNGIRLVLASTSSPDIPRRGVVLVDAQRIVVIGSGPLQPGERVLSEALVGSTPVVVDGQVAGYVMPLLPREWNRTGAQPADLLFLQRVAWASVVSAGIAALAALVLGGLLARGLTRPVRELTAATQAMARGELDQRVAVRSRDEIGGLAESFNRMSADLARASQLRKQMTADLAHDLRTPLTILRGYAEGLQDGRLQGTAGVYQVMHGEVQHLQRLVEDLRVLSLADAGELPLSRRAVDPVALLERTALAYVVEAEQRGVALRVEAAAQLPSVHVDTDRMTQVLNNLVSNALRHTPEGGTITLSAEGHVLSAESQQRAPTLLSRSGSAGEGSSPQPRGRPASPGVSRKRSTQHSALSAQHAVLLRVSDTGCGIDPDALPFVFERFYRADASRHREESAGSGLGLAISRAIVEAHGGQIGVESAAGQGTTFTITLTPAAPEGARA
ncbi:MAG: hypothetical protein RLZZ387_2689 [Chloroflexota bacterium]|jgi:two-component system sensor histidine kinase BaeS